MSGFTASPARLAHARQLAAQRELAQHDPREAELAVVAARAPGDAAAPLHARGAGVAPELREAALGRELVVERRVRVLHDLAQRRPLGRLLADVRDAPVVAAGLGELRHE